MKYLIVPSKQIGDYWARELGLNKKEYFCITKTEDIRGRFNNELKSNIYFIKGEIFDYPEYSDNRLTKNFIGLCDEIEKYYIKRVIDDV